MSSNSDIGTILLPDFIAGGNAGRVNIDDEGRVEVNEGALIAFSDTVDRQATQDVENSVLFAQLAADHKGSRTADPARWLTDFIGTLTMVGWSTQQFTNETVRLDGPVDWAAFAGKHMPTDAAEQIVAAVESADLLPPDSDAATIWNKAVSDGADAAFILAAASIGDMATGLDLQFTSFKFSPAKIRFVTWDLVYVTSFSWLSLELNEDVYAKVRGTVVKKLGDRPKYLIASVPTKQEK